MKVLHIKFLGCPLKDNTFFSLFCFPRAFLPICDLNLDTVFQTLLAIFNHYNNATHKGGEVISRERPEFLITSWSRAIILAQNCPHPDFYMKKKYI